MDVKAIAKALNVRTILEGSVREAGDRVRIAAELVDATNGFQIWSASYDRDLTNILALQDDIARAITQAVAQRFLGHKVMTSSLRTNPQTIDPEAYKAYLQGQYYFAQRTREGITRAIQLFTQTTERAPKYADGFAALGTAQATAALDFQMLNRLPAATDAINKALALQPRNSTALMARVTVDLLQWRWRAAAADLRRLDQLHLNTAGVWHMRAVFFDYMGLQHLAGPAEEKAVQLDPLSFIDRYNLAVYHMVAKQYAVAQNIAAEAWALQPGNADVQQLKVQIALGVHDVKAAERILTALSAQSGDVSGNVAASQFYIDVAKKDFAAARKLVDAVAKQFPAVSVTATDLGTAYAIMGDIDSALKWYRRAVDLHESQFLRVPYASPELTKVFADPRWKVLRAQPAIQDWESARADIAREFERGE